MFVLCLAVKTEQVKRARKVFRVPKIILNNGEWVKELTTKRRNKWLHNLSLASKGAESKNACVCSDHFVKGIYYNFVITDKRLKSINRICVMLPHADICISTMFTFCKFVSCHRIIYDLSTCRFS